MPGRQFSLSSYRFGFNGKEEDDDVKGNGNSLDFGARIYDNRLGRWLSIDPLDEKYIGLTPYNGMGNNPIFLLDNDGKKITVSTTVNKDGSLTVLVRIDAKMINLTANNDPSLINSVLSQIESDVIANLQGQYEGSGLVVHFQVSISIKPIQSVEEIQKDDHVIAIVDNIPKNKQYDDNGKELDPIAIAKESGNIILVEESTIKKSGSKRTMTHEIGHWLGLDDNYTKKDGGDPKRLMNNQGGTLIIEPEMKIMIQQYTGNENKGNIKQYRNANKDNLGSGDSKRDLKDFIVDTKTDAIIR